MLLGLEDCSIPKILTFHAIFQHCLSKELFQGVLAKARSCVSIVSLALSVPYKHALCAIVLPNPAELCAVLHSQAKDDAVP